MQVLNALYNDYVRYLTNLKGIFYIFILICVLDLQKILKKQIKAHVMQCKYFHTM